MKPYGKRNSCDLTGHAAARREAHEQCRETEPALHPAEIRLIERDASGYPIDYDESDVDVFDLFYDDRYDTVPWEQHYEADEYFDYDE